MPHQVLKHPKYSHWFVKTEPGPNTRSKKTSLKMPFARLHMTKKDPVPYLTRLPNNTFCEQCRTKARTMIAEGVRAYTGSCLEMNFLAVIRTISLIDINSACFFYISSSRILICASISSIFAATCHVCNYYLCYLWQKMTFNEGNIEGFLDYFSLVSFLQKGYPMGTGKK